MKYTIVSLLLVLLLITPALAAEKFSVLDVAPKGFEAKVPTLITKETAQEALLNAEKDIEDMRKLNFVTLLASDAQLEAKQAYGEGDYGRVFLLTQLISFIKKEKIEFLDRLKLLEVKKQTAAERGILDLNDINKVVQQAMTSFSLEQYDEANRLLSEANVLLDEASSDLQRKKLVDLFSKNYFARNWWIILIVIVVLVAIGVPTGKFVNKKRLQRKLRLLKLELKETKNLIKKLQTECFVKKTITVDAFKLKNIAYEEKITELQSMIPVVEAGLKGKKVKEIKIKGVLKV